MVDGMKMPVYLGVVKETVAPVGQKLVIAHVKE